MKAFHFLRMVAVFTGEEKGMRFAFRILAALVLFAQGSAAGAGDKSPDKNKLGALERFAGEWTVEGKWADGSSLKARNIYEWGLGKKILRARTYVMNGDKEYQRYEGMLAWHPEKKSLFEISFAFDGSLTEVLIESKDKDTLHIGWTPFTEGKPSDARQTIKFLDNDRFQWVVQLKQGDDWKQLIDATWRRKVSAR